MESRRKRQLSSSIYFQFFIISINMIQSCYFSSFLNVLFHLAKLFKTIALYYTIFPFIILFVYFLVFELELFCSWFFLDFLLFIYFLLLFCLFVQKLEMQIIYYGYLSIWEYFKIQLLMISIDGFCFQLLSSFWKFYIFISLNNIVDDARKKTNE